MQLLLNLLLLLVVLGLPAYLVIRAKRATVMLGAAAFWLLVPLCAETYRVINGSAWQRGAATGGEEWLMEGWLVGLAYATLVRLLTETFDLGRRALHVYHEQADCHFSLSQVFRRIWRELNQMPDGSLSAEVSMTQTSPTQASAAR